jgi:hypothetical protein
MSGTPSPKPPPALLAMNFIGSLLLAAGVAKAAGLDLPTDGVLPEGYPIVLIAAGLLLEIPLVRHLVGHARRGGAPRGPGEA